MAVQEDEDTIHIPAPTLLLPRVRAVGGSPPLSLSSFVTSDPLNRKIFCC